MKTFLLTFGLFLSLIPLLAVGTKDIDVNSKGIALSFNKSTGRYNNFMRYNCKEEERLYISLNQGEKLLFGLQTAVSNAIPNNATAANTTGTWIRIKDKTGNIVFGPVEIKQGEKGYINTRAECDNGPLQLNGAGYNNLEFLAPSTDDFYMEIAYNTVDGNTDALNQTYLIAPLYDWTVVDDNDKIQNGRVWSKAWHILALGGFNPEGALNAQQYIYTDDGIISRLDYNGIIPYQYILISNATGALATGDMVVDRQSIASPLGNELLPQYKLFFDEPDTNIFKLANLDSLFGSLNKTIDVTGCPGDYCINIDVNRDANAKLLIDLNGITGFQQNTEDVLLEVILDKGKNCVKWDGKDGLGGSFKAAAIIVDIEFVAGITHLPMYDVEFNNNGLRVDFIYPKSIAKQAEIYWDDSKLNGTVNDLLGCPSACHTWTNSAYGNEKIINSWWYITKDPVSSSIQMDTYTLKIEDDKTICEGDSIQLIGPDDMISYEWTPVTNIIDNDKKDATVFPKITTEYKLTVIDKKSCEYKDSLTVFVNQRPIVVAVATPQILCINDKSVLSVSGAKTYSWDNSLGTGTSKNITPILGKTLYEVIGTDDKGCKDTATVEVTVNALPVITLSDETICKNDKITLNASGGTKYLWKNTTTGLSSTIISNPEATPIVTTTYTVEVTDANDCVSEKDVKVTVNALPVITVNDETICKNDKVTLNVSGGTKYLWKNTTTGLSSTIISNPEATPIVTTTYTVEVTDANDCVSEKDVKVTVNELPVITVNDEIICENDKVTLNASGGTKYLWKNTTTGLSSTSISNPEATPIVSTIYTVEVTDANDCVSEKDVKVTVNKLPIITVNDETICKNDKITLNASGGAKYLWKNTTTGLSSTNISNPEATPIVTTTYTVEVTDINDCVSEKDVKVTVNELPVISVLPRTICKNDKVILNASGGEKYLWKNITTGLSSTIISNPEATPIVSTTYTVEVTDANDCVSEKDVMVTVNPLPTPSFVNPKLIVCPEEVTTYQVTGSPNSIFTWNITPSSKIDKEVPLNDKNTITFAKIDGNVTLEVTEKDVNDCKAIVNQVIKIDDLVTIDFDLIDGICADASAIPLTMATPTTGGIGNYTLNAKSINTIDPAILPKDISLPIKYQFITTVGCEYEKAQTIVINSLPVISFLPINSICSTEDAIVLREANPKGIGGVYSGLGVSNNTFDPKTIGLVIGGANNITYTYTDENNCVSSENSTIIVYPQPNVLLDKDIIICEGENDFLTAISLTNNVTYQWFKDNSIIIGETSKTLNVEEEGSYQVEVSIKGCSQKSLPKTVDLIEVEIDAGKEQTILFNESINLSGIFNSNQNSIIKNMQWSNEIGVFATSLNTFTKPEQTTTYTIKVVDEYGCIAEDEVLITVLDPIKIPNGFTPNGDGKNETWIIANIEDYPRAMVKVFNRWGDVVYMDYGYLNNWNGTSNGENLPNATYYYVVELNYNNLSYGGSVTIIR